MGPRAWRKYITGCLGHFSIEFKKRWEMHLHRVVGMELHQSGIPHLHGCYIKPPKKNLYSIEAWMAFVWAQIVNDERWWEVAVDSGNLEGIRDWTAAGGLSYGLKYFTKNNNQKLGAYIRDAWILNRMMGKTLDECDAAVQGWDWNHKIRRINVSEGWPRAKVGDQDSFKSGKGKVFNKHEYQKAYGRMYRAVTVNLEKLISAKTPDEIVSVQPIWEQTGPVDRFGNKAWEPSVKRRVTRAQTWWNHIADWRDYWEPMMQQCWMQANYANYGEDWQALGIAWDKPDDMNYWHLKIQMPDGKVGGIA